MIGQHLVGFIAAVGAFWGLQACMGAFATDLEMPSGAMLPMAGAALLTAMLCALVRPAWLNHLRAWGQHCRSTISESIGSPASEQMPYFLSAFGSDSVPVEPPSAVRRPLVAKLTILRCMQIAATALVVGLLCGVTIVLIQGNKFYNVTADVFRSAQLRSADWSETYSAHPYRSILNLRGKAEGRSWYTQETNFSAEHGLAHYDFKLSSMIVPSDSQMDELVALMREAPKPLLIHCRSGADRTGLVSGLYLYAIEGVDPAEASKQLSVWYGHFPWLTSRTGAMDEALARFIRSHPR